MIQDFEISITAIGGDQYLIRTENVAKGVQLAEEKVSWPVAHWLGRTQALMHDPLLGLLKGQQRHARKGQFQDRGVPPRSNAPTVTAEATTLVHLGQTLHKALFQGQLHDSWVTAQGIAQNRQSPLRLRIGMKDDRLQQLPWEALHAGTRPLATGTDVIFSRYILDRRKGHSVPLDKRKADKPLRILMVIASPDDQERLELKQEVKHLRSELHPVVAGGVDAEDALLDIQLTILEQPGRAELTQELDRGDYQVLHYAGHSDLGNAGGDIYLVSRQTGLTERLSGEDLAGLLVNNGIRLAVFNSCRGGYSSGSEQGWQERNLAQALVNRGMPGVIAMAERIPDDVAITFTQLLYRNLKKGKAVDLSLNRTRQGLISAYGSHQFYWALPTLYMQPAFDGYLLATEGDREQSERIESGNDPFGDLFTQPGLGSIDWPMKGQKPQMPSGTSALPSRSSYSINRTGVLSGEATADELSKTNQQNLVDNNDASIAGDVIKRPGAPPSSVDIDAEIDGELRVPEDIKTPRGFYGEPITPKSTSLSANRLSSDAKSVSRGPTQSDQAQAASTETPSISTGTPAVEVPSLSAEAPEDSLPPTPKATPDVSADTPSGGEIAHSGGEELIGERLTRSHTVHTKILTVPGLASIAIALLLGAMTIIFFHRVRTAEPVRTGDRNELSQDELGLPAQIEVALLQENIDAAITPTKALIDNGEYAAAIAALETASNRQQRDVVISFFRGRAQWGLVKQGSADYAADDAMRSWQAALDSEPDWMEISMALGFAQYAIGREQQALESWEKAVELAERQSAAQITYFSDRSVEDYTLNAYAGLAMVSLALSKIEVDPDQRNQLLDKAAAAYQRVLDEAPADFSPKTLGNNWLWLSPAIADWVDAKRELSQLVE